MLGRLPPFWVAIGHNGLVRDARPPSSSPIPITTGPLGSIDLLDGAFHSLRQRPGVIMLSTLAVVVPLTVLGIVVDARFLGDGSHTVTGFGIPTVRVISYGPSLGGAVVIALGWLGTALGGLMTARIVTGWLHGRDDDLRSTMTFLLQRLPSAMGVFVITHVVGFALLAVLPELSLVAAIPMILCCLCSPVMAMEAVRNPFIIIGRSVRLVRRQVMGVVAVMIWFAVVLATLAIGLSLVLASDETMGAELAVVTVLGFLISCLLVPLNGAAMALLYLDIRFRTEGYDLALRGQQILGRPTVVEVGEHGG